MSGRGVSFQFSVFSFQFSVRDYVNQTVGNGLARYVCKSALHCDKRNGQAHSLQSLKSLPAGRERSCPFRPITTAPRLSLRNQCAHWLWQSVLSRCHCVSNIICAANIIAIATSLAQQTSFSENPLSRCGDSSPSGGAKRLFYR